MTPNDITAMATMIDRRQGANTTFLQPYILCLLFLRSLSNGIDRICGTPFSLPLSLLIIAVSIASCYILRNKSINREVIKVILYLILFNASCILSFLVAAYASNSIIDYNSAWYSIFRYGYWISILLAVASVYQDDTFCINTHRLYLGLLFVTSAVGLAQYLTGNVIHTPLDRTDRIAGLSSHPVTFSMEIVLIFCVCELSR